MMRWRKHELVFRPAGDEPWARTHAMIPTPLARDGDALRIFHSSCDREGRASIAWVDLDARDPTRILGRSGRPLLSPGRPGTFDENGVVATSVVQVDASTLYLYYVGFELGTRIRYRLLTGLAVSRDGGERFERLQETPILERSPDELYFRCGPFVLREQGLFRMWYVAGGEWLEVDGKLLPVYRLKHLASDDGVRWGPAGTLCLDFAGGDEHGFGRPWVVPRPGGYELYYSIRRRSLGAYRLGYATSADGLRWDRRDAELGLDVSPGGFDADAIMYAAVVESGGRTWCFYNGDNFGEAGFGLAERMAE